jgi:3-hydroxybutyryl-CoA dehydrogenase
MERIGIVGAGTMGTCISHLFAEGGHKVILADIARRALDDARAEIARNARLEPLVCPSASHLSPEEVIARIDFSTDLKDLRGATYVIERITENCEVKRRLYAELDDVCPPGTPFGVSTVAIPITRIAGITSRAPHGAGTTL